ncbi:MAG: DUF3187 family protein [Pseudomonadales bacterium]|nr:DUF3187 family protein [Pseudomonadales bacterium]
MSVSDNTKNSFFLSLLTLLFILSFSLESQASLSGNQLQPLELRSQSFFHALRLNTHSQNAKALNPSAAEISIFDDISSTWANSDDFVMDFNMNDLRLNLAWGLDNGWNMIASFSERRIMNTHLDQPTISFHKAMGLGQDGRLDVAKHRSLIGIDAYAIYVDDFNHLTLSRPIELQLSKQIFDSEASAIAVRIISQLETADSWTKKGSLDIAVQIDLRYQLAATALFASAAYSWLDQDDFLGLPLKNEIFMLNLGAAWAVYEHSAIQIQYQSNEGAVENMGELSAVNHEVSLGYRWQNRQWAFETAVTENLLTFYNSPDIAFHGGITYKI